MEGRYGEVQLDALNLDRRIQVHVQQQETPEALRFQV
jgi:hypothetical protein